MFEVTILGPRNETGERPGPKVLVPALPRIGDWIEHEPSGVKGDVKSVSFWWDEHGKLTVTVEAF